MIKFSIAITTRNRMEDLKYTLSSLKPLIARDDVELLLCDDASNDGTTEYLSSNFLENTIFNTKAKGLIYNRNKLNNLAKGEFIISLDDDANFLCQNPFDKIEHIFRENPNCAVVAFHIYWGQNRPKISILEDSFCTKSFVGCGHAWRKSIWDRLDMSYPSWYKFYGEEEFASFKIFKNGYKIMFNSAILVHHRVNVKGRKKDKDYIQRTRRALRAAWFNYLIFLPLNTIPKKIAYSIYMQFKLKTLRGDFRATLAMLLALVDFIYFFPINLRHTDRLSCASLKTYSAINDTVIYYKSN